MPVVSVDVMRKTHRSDTIKRREADRRSTLPLDPGFGGYAFSECWEDGVKADPYVAAFIREGERRHLSPNTLEDRRRLLNRFVRWAAPLPLTDVGQGDIEQWLDSCNIGPRSRYSYISTLAAFYRFVQDAGGRPDDPTRKIRRPKLGRLLPRPISDADLDYALSVADSRMRCWLALAAFDGLRCAEIANLRREDIMDDHDPPILIVRQGKGQRDRIVPLNPAVEDALRAYGLRQGYLFHLNDGSRIGPRTVSCYIGRFLRSHGVNASAHRGRHKFGTDVYRESGGDIRMTQELLGHEDPKTTAIYADFDPVKAAAVVRQLGAQRGLALGAAKGVRDDGADQPNPTVDPSMLPIKLEPGTHFDHDGSRVGDPPVTDAEGCWLNFVPSVADQEDGAHGCHVGG